MANRFWVGGGANTNWNATSNTNWATITGGANNASVPTTTDVAIFDGNSGVGNSVISAIITIQGLDCTGGTGSYAGTLTHSSGTVVTINTGAASSLRLSSAMTYTPGSSGSGFTFTHTSGTAQITSAGKQLAAITVNGAGGTTQQQDDLLINAVQNATLTITSGIYDCNSHALTAILNNFSGSTTRSFLLGSSVTCGGNLTAASAPWSGGTTTNLTFTKNSANITVLSPTSSITSQLLSFGALTYNGLTINQTSSGVVSAFSGAATFATLAVGAGNALSFTNSTTYTISSAFTLAGSASAPIFLKSASDTSLATLSVPSGTCSLDWGVIFNITASGGATFNATDTLAAGTNSGWAIIGPSPSGITAAQCATAVWQDLLSSGDFSTSSSIGAMLKASQNLQFTIGTVARGTVTTGASTTSIPTSALAFAAVAATGVVANQLVGRVVLFDGATTTAGLRGAVSTITAASASNTPTFTVSPALPATPASGDLFSVI